MILFAILLLSMFITIALIPIIKNWAVKINVMDMPNERKVHTRPVPRAGGIAMAFGWLMPVLFWLPHDRFVVGVLIGAGIVVVLGLIDDIVELNHKLKFIGQAIAAIIVMVVGQVKITFLGTLLPAGYILPEWLAIAVTLLVIIGVTNAINLADGLDGLAGGIVLLSFLGIAVLAYQAGNTTIALFAVAVIGATFGFLRFNTYPATVFMGDAGSEALGFLAVTLALKLTQGGASFSPLVPLLLLGFPILDTAAVMVERVRKGRNIFIADKNHFHHKLMDRGLYHTEAVFFIYIFHAFLVTIAFVFRFYSDWILLMAYLIISGALLSLSSSAESRGWRLERPGFIDRAIKGRLKGFKQEKLFITMSFRVIEICVPGLLIITSFLVRGMPSYLKISTLVMIVLMLLTWIFRSNWFALILRIAVYLLVPFIVYLSEVAMISAWPQYVLNSYNLSFGLLILCVILTLKLTRRTKGFKSSPLDFLILFIALAIPNLPDPQIQSFHMQLIAVKIIVFFFSYEVLIGERRGELNQLGLWTTAALIVFVLNG
jgi:UDP-GlcNAc:undecaprenyl-phosphate/decaprenyl-phosphate GlcNAc-1-phosphate transferase